MGGVRRTGVDMEFFVNDIMHFSGHLKKKVHKKFSGQIPVKSWVKHIFSDQFQ
jgi:hypothetical protein